VIQRFLRRLSSRFGPALQSDTAFIEMAYRQILNRPADQDGLSYYQALLRDGLGRTSVLLSLFKSDEFINQLRPVVASERTGLRPLRPAQYEERTDRTNGKTLTVFRIDSAADFDWLETAILEHGYYEKPGVWNFGIDTDKRVIAEIIASLGPSRAIELGCAAGAVLLCLQRDGVDADGIEISSLAIQKAEPDVRAKIHQGDLLQLDIAADFDVAFGLDVFEHLNPNRLDAYITRLTGLLREQGIVFCNVPAFGNDPEFGTVFSIYVEDWEADARAARLFSSIHVDELGFPIHGHLVWADAPWWVGRFEAAGLSRDVGIERALHRKYDSYMEQRAPARKAFFVFSRGLSADRRASILHRISQPSTALAR
jgi:2-polyprenyl-3-methyl-5-hydroxy-6-metoxy-1,4-benzoquinol methylase